MREIPDLRTLEDWDRWKDSLHLGDDVTREQRDVLLKAFLTLPKEERRRSRQRSIAGYFRPESRSSGWTSVSPSGRWRLEVDVHETAPGIGRVSRGRAYRSSDGACVADVKRNYGAFPFAWVEDHPAGGDYLACGEDYQGQTIVRLDTGERRDHDSGDAARGFGFCWAEIDPSPDGTLLAVRGCIWGGGFDMVLYDFAEPLAEHAPIALARSTRHDRFVSWHGPDACVVACMQWVRRSDGTPLSELPDAEADALEDTPLAEERPEEVWLLRRPAWIDVALEHAATLARHRHGGGEAPDQEAALAAVLARLSPDERAEYDRRAPERMRAADEERRARLAELERRRAERR